MIPVNTWKIVSKKIHIFLGDVSPFDTNIIIVNNTWISVKRRQGPIPCRLRSHLSSPPQIDNLHLWELQKSKRAKSLNIAKGTTDPGVDCFDQ